MSGPGGSAVFQLEDERRRRSGEPTRDEYIGALASWRELGETMDPSALVAEVRRLRAGGSAVRSRLGAAP